MHICQVSPDLKMNHTRSDKGAEKFTVQNAIDIFKNLHTNDDKLNKAIALAIIALEMQDGNLYMDDIPSGVHIGKVATLVSQ